MENPYLYIVILLAILAIGDLIVGVSNDAVNFLNSAIGSKAISFKNIMILASLGIAIGAISSSGMMEVARKGIFNPEMFLFSEIMIIFIAVMITDILLLDLFNSYGLPTSTTVSIVFELLGAAVVISIIKISTNSDALLDLSTYINTSKATQIIFGIFLLTSPPKELENIAWITAGVALLMTIWWISEAIPIYVTGLIPLIAFPLLGLYELKVVASSYAHPLVLLFLGGFIIASAMESSGLHKRIALKILTLCGTSPSKIIGGFMITTALLSMWVSNTASTIMMLPIATSVITIFSSQSKIKNNQFAIPHGILFAVSQLHALLPLLVGIINNNRAPNKPTEVSFKLA